VRRYRGGVPRSRSIRPRVPDCLAATIRFPIMDVSSTKDTAAAVARCHQPTARACSTVFRMERTRLKEQRPAEVRTSNSDGAGQQDEQCVDDKGEGSRG
jgi:hypothetical protein